MRALFSGGDSSLKAAQQAFDHAMLLGPKTVGPQGEALFYNLPDIRLKAPIIPKKFFHTAGNFREHHEEATKAGFSHPVMPWIVFFRTWTQSSDRTSRLFIPSTHAGTGLRTGTGGRSQKRQANTSRRKKHRLHRRIRDFQRHHRARHSAPGDEVGRLQLLQRHRYVLSAGTMDCDRDEIPDPHNLAMELRVNGESRQRSHSSKMSVKIPEILSHYSPMGYSQETSYRPARFRESRLSRGDPKAWYLKPGDVMECEIEKIGVLRNPVISWEEAYGSKPKALATQGRQWSWFVMLAHDIARHVPVEHFSIGNVIETRLFQNLGERFNTRPEIRDGFPKTTIRFYDTTFAMASKPWASCCPRSRSLEIALKLDELGIGRIEAGFPRVSPEDAEAIQMMQKAGIKAELWGFSRAVKADVDELVRLGIKASVIESPTSDIKLKAYGITPDELLRRVEAAIMQRHTKALQLHFSRWTEANGTRIPEKVYLTALDAGANEIVVVDTIGACGPEAAEFLVRKLRAGSARRSGALAWTQRLRDGNSMRSGSRARRSNLDSGHHQWHGGASRQCRHRERSRWHCSACTTSPLN